MSRTRQVCKTHLSTVIKVHLGGNIMIHMGGYSALLREAGGLINFSDISSLFFFTQNFKFDLFLMKIKSIMPSR